MADPTPTPFHETPMRIKPPHTALIYLAIASALHWGLPGSRVFTTSWFPWGFLIMFFGLLPPAWALRTFKRHDTTHDPHGQPTAMVEDGPFRYTRNPMYLGVTLFLAGIASLAGSLPFLLVPVAFAFTMHVVFIPREERRLEHLFGSAYLTYKARVRRWG